MQAIITKYIGPSNVKGSRVKATAEAGSVTLSWDNSLGDNHRAAALALATKLGWNGTYHGGMTFKGDMVWIQAVGAGFTIAGTMSESEARYRAGQDKDYRARFMHGRWVVWSDASDHVVEYSVPNPVKPNAKTVLQAALDAWPQFDGDDYVSGADMIDWFTQWREQARAALRR